VALELTGRGYVLEHGRVVNNGPAAVLLADPEARATYLGV
jgi:ABC-type branched-subunit amino acid transport system ATPase component